MEVLEQTKHTVSKYQMLERLQFSKNLQIAIKANQLLLGEIGEQDIKGLFLDAVCRNDYADAIKRADDHNLAAIKAKDFSVGKFMFIHPDKLGYVTGEKYYLKIKTVNGYIQVTPPVNSDATELIYPNFSKFFYDFKSI